MPILNYTTEITAEKTAAEIQALLAASRAQAVMSEYDDQKVLVVISFRIQSAHGMLTFRLPANVQRIYQVMVRQPKVPQRLRTFQQASRVAWRIIKVWLQAQLALIEAGMVDMEQVFLPYAQFNGTGLTTYETLVQNGFANLALPAPDKKS